MKIVICGACSDAIHASKHFMKHCACRKVWAVVDGETEALRVSPNQYTQVLNLADDDLLIGMNLNRSTPIRAELICGDAEGIIRRVQ